MATTESKDIERKVRRFYNTLHQQIEEEEFEDALLTSDKILKLVPDDAKALRCKIVCMIYENQIDGACKLAAKVREKIPCEFELAYTYYRLNKLDEAFQILEKSDKKDTR